MDVWIQQNVGNENIFVSLVKQRLSDNFIQNWNSRLTDSFRALFYRNFTFDYKCYLDTVTTNKFRFALSRLRLSSHRLEIETGRWARPNSTPIENRLCTSCQKLEDEYHFVLECVRYNELRRTLIPNYYLEDQIYSLQLILKRCREICQYLYLRHSRLGNNTVSGTKKYIHIYTFSCTSCYQVYIV